MQQSQNGKLCGVTTFLLIVYNIKMLTTCKVGENGFPILHPSSTSSNAPDNLLEKLNSYHPRIKFTMEENPDQFLDTSFNHQKGTFTTKNYKYIGDQPSQKVGSATLFEASYIKQNEQPPTGKQKSKTSNEIDIVCYFENPIIPVHWFDERPKLGI